MIIIIKLFSALSGAENMNNRKFYFLFLCNVIGSGHVCVCLTNCQSNHHKKGHQKKRENKITNLQLEQFVDHVGSCVKFALIIIKNKKPTFKISSI